MSTSILLADGQRLVREGITSILAARSDYLVVGEAADGDQALEMASRMDPDLVLMELTLPALSGFEVMRRLRERGARTRCIAVTAHRSGPVIVEAMRAGAMGYVPKDAPATELIQAIDAVSAGRLFAAPEIAPFLLHRFAGTKSDDAGSSMMLTDREREVLRMISNGLRTKEIAKELFISPKTVDTHRTNLMRKLHTRNVASLVRIAMQEGLVAN